MWTTLSGFTFTLDSGLNIQGFDTVADCLAQAIRSADCSQYAFPMQLGYQMVGKYARLMTCANMDELLFAAIANGASIPLSYCPRIDFRSHYVTGTMSSLESFAILAVPCDGSARDKVTNRLCSNNARTYDRATRDMA